MSSVVKDLDEGVTSRRTQGGFNISDHHAEGDDHNEAHGAVDNSSPDHRQRKTATGISQLLGHVSGSIRPNKREHRRQDTNKTTRALCAPSSAIVERHEHLARWFCIRQYPQDNQDGEEASDMNNHHDTFQQRQLRGQECVEDVAESEHGEDDQGTVPWLGFVARVVQDHQTLNDGAAKITDGSVADLPAEDTEPADEVGKLLLRLRRAEFRDPV